MLLMCSCARDVSNLPIDQQVDQPAECEKILERVNVPDRGRKYPARTAYLEQKAGVITANGRIAAGRTCIEDQRAKYSGAAAQPGN